ncbi:MAG TPA: hypothetical protein VMP01_00975, partial [Pirellulaceae bacterium]|nr:hypothetical protein [Pirellulaceae bacterium]
MLRDHRVRRRSFLAQVEVLEPRCMLAGLLLETDLSYLGAFRLPGGTFGASSFDFGGGALSINPATNSMFMTGHAWQKGIAEINIPPLLQGPIGDLNTATVRQPFVEIMYRLPTLVEMPGYGGTLIVDGDLIGTIYNYYDADTPDVVSHFRMSGLDLETGTMSGLYQVGDMGAGYVAGWMAPVPEAWQAALGTEYLTGQGGLPIISRTSWGPALFGFDPAQLGDTAAPAVPLLYYTGGNPLAPITGPASELWNGATSIKGVIFPEGSDSVLFIGSHGTGESWYGTPPDGGDDPLRGDKGYHAYPYRYQVWAYSAHDLAAVKAGTKQPWEVQPYDI